MKIAKIGKTVVDDETLRLLQKTVCDEIIQKLGLVIFSRSLHKAISQLEESVQRTNEILTITARTKPREESEVADQYKDPN